MASPLCTPKNVAIDASTRAISIATKPLSSGLPPRQSVTLESDTADVQLGELRQQFKRKGVFNPVLVDDGRDFFLQKPRNWFNVASSSGFSSSVTLVKVAIWSRELLGLPKFLCGRLHCCTCRAMGLLLVLIRFELVHQD